MVRLEDIWCNRCARFQSSGAQTAPPFVFKIICTPCGSVQLAAAYIQRLCWNPVLRNICKGACCGKTAAADQTDIAGVRVLQSGAAVNALLQLRIQLRCRK